MKKYLVISFLFAMLPLVTTASSFDVLIETKGENINALEGVIELPEQTLEVNVETGGSAIVVWLTTPKFNSDNKIVFSGITPGGFNGTHKIFTIEGEFEEKDLRYTRSEISALKNDGEGSEVPVSIVLRKQDDIAEDKNPPEPFKVIAASSADIYDGRKFISFLAQDKETGVDHYEYADAFFLKPSSDQWVEVTSPYPLSFSAGFKKIFIRAVDQEENIQLSTTVGSYYYMSRIIGLIILVSIICVLYFRNYSLRSY